MGCGFDRYTDQGPLDQLSEMVFFGHLHRNGVAVRPRFSQILQAPLQTRFGWLLAGGIIYTIGGIIYALKVPLFNSKHKNFGSHEIFHLFVMGGSICHFILMYFFVAPMPV